MAARRAALVTVLVTAVVLAAGPTTVASPRPAKASAEVQVTHPAAGRTGDQDRAKSVATSLTPVLAVAGTEDQLAAVDEAVTTFASLGMALPDLDIRFHDDQRPCNGHLGLFRPQPSGWVIEVCATDQFVVPHELGHAWERAALTSPDRQLYMSARGFDTWRNDSRAESAMEDVAFVIQLVVLGRGRGEAARPEIEEAFALLMELAA